ncbi:hypothetical protein TRVL_00351 [Trypanosoma vivax]|nr:hypothetical protein TRVL_00351 [Trypanosoma vivax]
MRTAPEQMSLTHGAIPKAVTPMVCYCSPSLAIQRSTTPLLVSPTTAQHTKLHCCLHWWSTKTYGSNSAKELCTSKGKAAEIHLGAKKKEKRKMHQRTGVKEARAPRRGELRTGARQQ